MPVGPVIDTHVHLWNPGLIRYPWLDHHARLNRPYLLDDYRAATASVPIESMIFVQCEAEASAFEAEAAWVAGLTSTEPRLKGLVAWAPLEKGSAVRTELEALQRHAILRGIRRIIQSEADIEFCLRPDFIAGVRLLADFDLTFDICVDHRQMRNVIEFAARVPEIPMVLDHIGKPAIKAGVMHPWADQMRELARLPHVSCKISGVATEADSERWTNDELKGYIEVAVDAFGFERIMFGGDWPVSTLAIEYRPWVELLDDVLAGVPASEQKKFWRDNAARFYRV
jgi:L-fuconolactonase